jgi:hypothetical protein
VAASEQDFARIRVEFAGFGQKSGSLHLGHALIHQKEGHGIIAPLELLDGFQGLLTRAGCQNAIVAAVVLAQIALDGWFWHGVGLPYIDGMQSGRERSVVVAGTLVATQSIISIEGVESVWNEVNYCGARHRCYHL